MNEGIPSKQDALNWFRELERLGGACEIQDSPEEKLHATITTATSQYSVTCQWPESDRRRGYLGAIATDLRTLKEMDLHNGELSQECWTKVLADIVAFAIAPERTDAGAPEASAEKFVNTLWGNTQPGILNVWSQDTNLSTHCRGAREVDEAVREHHHTGVHLGLAALPPEGEYRKYQRTRRSNMLAAIPGLWANLEISNAQDNERAAAQVMDRMPIRPTMALRTGPGVQALWLFKRPWNFKCQEEQRAAEALSRWLHRRLEDEMKGTGIQGSTGGPDLIKMIRMPGTRREKGGEEARIVRLNGPRPTHNEFMRTAIDGS